MSELLKIDPKSFTMNHSMIEKDLEVDSDDVRGMLLWHRGAF
jgi:hypothetical protein